MSLIAHDSLLSWGRGLYDAPLSGTTVKELSGSFLDYPTRICLDGISLFR